MEAIVSARHDLEPGSSASRGVLHAAGFFMLARTARTTPRREDVREEYSCGP